MVGFDWLTGLVILLWLVRLTLADVLDLAQPVCNSNLRFEFSLLIDISQSESSHKSISFRITWKMSSSDIICERIHDGHGTRWERGGICVACVVEMMDRSDVSVRTEIFGKMWNKNSIYRAPPCGSSRMTFPSGGAQARGARGRDARGRGSGAAVLRRGTKNKLHLIIAE